MTKFNPADYQDLKKMNKKILQKRYDAVVSLKNAYKFCNRNKYFKN